MIAAQKLALLDFQISDLKMPEAWEGRSFLNDRKMSSGAKQREVVNSVPPFS